MTTKEAQIKALQAKYDNTIKRVQELQELEKYMFKNLQDLNSNNSQNNSGEKQMIKKRINELSSMRKSLFVNLSAIFKEEQQGVSDNRHDLTDQLTVVKVVENELDNAKNKLNAIKEDKANKMRMVEIADWENDRFQSHKNIMKYILYCCIAVIICIPLYRIEMLPKWVPSVLIVLSISGTIIKMLTEMWWNFRRDDRFWDKYDQGDTSHLNDLENPFADGANDVGGSKFKFGCKSASQFAEQLRKQQREIQSKVGVKLRQGFQNIEAYEENEAFSSI